MSEQTMGTWEVAAARAWARARLAEAGVASPDADVRELLEWACDASSQWALPTHLDEDQKEKFCAGVSERALRIPLQHVTGRMYFRSLTLQSVPGVFVVRPETEVLAGLAIDEAAAVVAARGEARVVELCTGSGAIALAVATESAHTEVWAVEKEPDPFALACLNRDRVGACGLHLVRGDATQPATLGFLDGLGEVVVSGDEIDDVGDSLAGLDRQIETDPHVDALLLAGVGQPAEPQLDP